MLESNVEKILALIKPNHVVLDVGGWACPFNRANWILDCSPYETRGYYATIGLPKSQGHEKEYFTPDTWVQRDVCAREPWPFKDRFFDFSICSQTLEDTRDPLFICSELIRTSKRGYIEVPSRVAESCRGWERDNLAGLSHHRWLIEMEGTHISFLQKFHMIHAAFDLSFPASFLRRLTELEKNSFLFWEDSFTFEEIIIHGLENQAQNLRQFVAERHHYPSYRTWLDSAKRESRRVFNGLARRLG